jgi:hypothetical protein
MVNDRKTADSAHVAVTTGAVSTTANLRRQRRKTEDRLFSILEMTALEESCIYHGQQRRYDRKSHYASHALTRPG